MNIAVIGSMHFTEQMLAMCKQLDKLGHKAFLGTPSLANEFIGKSDAEKEVVKQRQKEEFDPIKMGWEELQKANAVLVLNLARHGILNYIGGNTLMEIGFAHILGQKIFLYNPIPDMQYCKTEIESVKPTIINHDLLLIQ